MAGQWNGRKTFKPSRSCATDPVAKSARCSFCGGPSAGGGFAATTLDNSRSICGRCVGKLAVMASLYKLSGLHQGPPNRWDSIKQRIQDLLGRDRAPQLVRDAVAVLVLALCQRAAQLLAGERKGLQSQFALVCQYPGTLDLVRRSAMAMGIPVAMADSWRAPEELASLCINDPLMIEIGMMASDHLVPVAQDNPSALVVVCPSAGQAPPGAKLFEVPKDNSGNN